MKQLWLITFQLFLLPWMPWVRGQICAVLPHQLQVWNGMWWGEWGPIEWCPAGSHASGFSIKVEHPQGGGDDTALNGIRLYCNDNNNRHVITIESAVGRWGDWYPMNKCTLGNLYSFQLRVEPSQGNGDDTAVNNIRFKCTDGTQLEGNGLNWGSWGAWSCECSYRGICGMQTRVEGPQGSGDDTSLNNVIFFCCS